MPLNSLETKKLDVAGQLLVFATRHWVYALSENRRLPCCVSGAFIRCGVVEVFDSWHALMHYLHQFAARKMQFGPLCNDQLTPAESMLINAIHELQIGHLGCAIRRLRGLVEETRMSELVEKLNLISSGLSHAGLEVVSSEPGHSVMSLDYLGQDQVTVH